MLKTILYITKNYLILIQIFMAQQTMPQNDQNPRVIGIRNTFPMSYDFADTLRYGEISPFFYMHGVKGDVINYRGSHDIRTYTLQSPLMSDVVMKKALFKVPMQALYLDTWEDVLAPIPTDGDDAPVRARAHIKYDAIQLLVDNLNVLISSISSANAITASDFNNLFHYVLALELFFSTGSIFSKFNINLWPLLRFIPEDNIYSFDTWFEAYFMQFVSRYVPDFVLRVQQDFDDGGNTNYTEIGVQTSGLTKTYAGTLPIISLREALELMRQFPFTISSATFSDAVSGLPLLRGLETRSSTLSSINIEPIIAYQLCCAHFYSSDKVDFIYTSRHYIDYLKFVASRLSTTFTSLSYFNVNGVRYECMPYSEVVLDNYIPLIANGISSAYGLYFLQLLFGYKHSLRFGDYFTGARPQPIAVGDVVAQVGDTGVSAIDTTRSIMMQKLLNNVNIAGKKYANYLKALFGGETPRPPKNQPEFLASEAFAVGGFEIENTGTAQQSKEQNIITTQLRASDSRFQYTISVDEPCIILGVVSFECKRFYSKTFDRMALHIDRLDDFIPQLEYTGDQEILQGELNTTKSFDDGSNFAYQSRYMEYKQRYSHIAGGFVEALPSWLFVTDNLMTLGFDDDNITPFFIRSRSSEFDRFYKSLTGFGLAGYFHFIVKFGNDVSASRQMSYNPEPLR